MWYMPVDQDFFPTTDSLTTFVDESPQFRKRRLVVHDYNWKDQSRRSSYEQKIRQNQQLTALPIEKIYHAQCLEKYPNHFATFVKLSMGNCKEDLKGNHREKFSVIWLCNSQFGKIYLWLISKHWHKLILFLKMNSKNTPLRINYMTMKQTIKKEKRRIMVYF